MKKVENQQKSKQKELTQQKEQNNKISVIIPVYNENPEVVKNVVFDILDGASDELLEVLVVDDGSLSFEFEYPDKRIKVLRKEHGGKGSAIKFGAQKAKGEILVFTDGDGELLVKWKDIENAVKLMQKKNLQAVFGVRKEKMSPHKILLRLFSFFVSVLSLKWFPDILCGFRIMRKKDFEFISTKSLGYGIEIEMFFRCVEKGIRVASFLVLYRTYSYKIRSKFNIIKSILTENKFI